MFLPRRFLRSTCLLAAVAAATVVLAAGAPPSASGPAASAAVVAPDVSSAVVAPDVSSAAATPDVDSAAVAPDVASAAATAAASRASDAAPRLRRWAGRPTGAELAALGKLVFHDASLSGSGRMSCATCHDPAFAFAPAPGTPNPFSDGDPAHEGTRAIPSLRYARYQARFSEHAFENDEEGPGQDEGPNGGLTWDGRADTPHEQALIPLFAAHEMANADAASLARRLAAAPYAARFRRAASAPGRDVFRDPALVVDWLAFALEVYERGPEFHPFDSRYDRALAGKVDLTRQELRGLNLFINPQKGNCESCHPATRGVEGAPPILTDGGFIAVGVPRSPRLPAPAASGAAPYPVAAAASGADYDLGLCRSGRPGLTADPSYCGRFRTPTLRNVATRTRFFHNGAFTSLRDVVDFYATRDSDPARWYPRNADGSVHLYDDLPPEYVPYVDHEAPFDPLPDHRARLSPQETDDLIAFLETLTDADMAPAARAARAATARSASTPAAAAARGVVAGH